MLVVDKAYEILLHLISSISERYKNQAMLLNSSMNSRCIISINFDFVSVADCSLLLSILRLDEEGMSLVDLAGEVLWVGQKEFEVNGGLIKEHTGDSWSILITEGLLDDTIDIVADKVVDRKSVV